MALCGRPRKSDSLPCENPVRRKGMACHLHGGPGALTNGRRSTARTTSSVSALRVPVVPPSAYGQTSRLEHATSTRQPPKPSSPPRSEPEKDRVRKAAEFCADSISSSWQDAVAEQVTEYAQTTWARLSRPRRRRRNCKALARTARLILEAKKQVHKGVGKLFGWGIRGLGGGDGARAFAEELASNIALPIDAKMIAVARGVQVAGILLCVMDGRDLTKCECFIDLALAETRERVKQILVAAMSDWVNLGRFRPRAAQAIQ
jgi:hypothetical protein